MVVRACVDPPASCQVQYHYRRGPTALWLRRDTAIILTTYRILAVTTVKNLPAAKITGADTSRPSTLPPRSPVLAADVSAANEMIATNANVEPVATAVTAFDTADAPEIDDAELGDFLSEALDGFDPNEGLADLCAV